MEATTYNRKKKVMPAMMPIKQWLSLNEAVAYMDISLNKLQDLISKNGLTVSTINAKKYYRVSELLGLIEENIIIRKIN